MAGLAFEQGGEQASVEAARGLHRSGDNPALAPPGARGVGEAGEFPHSVCATSNRRIDVVGFFPNKDAATRLIGAILVGQNEE